MNISDLDNENSEVCLCNHVTLKDLQDAVKNGARTLHGLEDATGAGTVCGGCREMMQEVIDNSI